MNNILHLSPHLGGGVGRVLLNYLSKNKYNPDYKHQIICLDSINENAKHYLNNEKFEYSEYGSKNIIKLKEKIKKADIVVIHWWNHPLLFELLVKYKLPACRLVIWSHVSGNLPPNNFSHTLFDYPDFFIFTTPMSYLVDEVITYKKKRSFKTIWSTAGLDYIKKLNKTVHQEFIVGYIGTIDFSKMYTNFISLCEKINIPNIKFIICGDGSDLNTLKSEVKNKRLSQKFVFTGFVNDIRPYLSQLDIFGYPLNANHYGTCDQVIAEAMGSGVVPVVFNNKMESYMVDDQHTGIVANNEEEYIAAIELLYQDSLLKKLLEENAKKEALQRFSLDSMIADWNKVFSELLYMPKSIRKWNGKYSGENISHIEVFYESIGTLGNKFEDFLNNCDKNLNLEFIKFISTNRCWLSKTKGTPFHYLFFFEQDKELKKLCLLIKNVGISCD